MLVLQILFHYRFVSFGYENYGCKKELTYNLEKPSIPVNICLSHEKAKQKYGWVPEVSLEEGMKKVIEWVKKME